MKMFLKRIVVKQRRNLLIFCMLLSISAFIFSYINLNGMTYFKHKPETHKADIHKIVRDSIRDQSFTIAKLSTNNNSNVDIVLDELPLNLKLINLRKMPEDKVHIPKDKFYDKLQKSLNGSVTTDKIGQRSNELQGNIEKQRFLYDKAYKDILQRSKQFEQDTPDKHNGYHPIQLSSRSQKLIGVHMVQNGGLAKNKNSVGKMISPGNGINVRKTDAFFEDKEKLGNEIKSVTNVLRNGDRKENGYHRNKGYQKNKGYRKDIYDNGISDTNYERVIGNGNNIGGSKDTSAKENGMTIGRVRNLIPRQQDINMAARKPFRNADDHGMESAHKNDVDSVKIFNGNINNWPIKFTEDDAPSNGKRPESCDGCMILNFHFVSNPTNLCKKHRQPPDLLILIASDPREDLARTAVRRSWGKVCSDTDSLVTCAFMVATTTDIAVNQQVLEESEKYHDIIVFSYIDSYQNLTYKTLMGLKWSQEFCSEAKYVMKTDQDVYVNTRQIPIMLQAAPKDHFSGGFCWGLSIPTRDDTSKWSIKNNEYSAPYLPKMCSGTGYILSRDVVSSILKVSPNIPFLFLEDVYVALCLEKLGVIPTNLLGFNNMRTEFSPCTYRYSVMTSHQISEASLIDYWEMTDECPPAVISPDVLYSPLHLDDLI